MEGPKIDVALVDSLVPQHLHTKKMRSKKKYNRDKHGTAKRNDEDEGFGENGLLGSYWSVADVWPAGTLKGILTCIYKDDSKQTSTECRSFRRK